MTLKLSPLLAAFVMCCLILPGASLWAQIEVNAIGAFPDPFETERDGATEITVNATAGLNNLQVHIFEEDQLTTVRTNLSLVETGVSGVYTVSWNGRNNSNDYVESGSYFLRVFSLTTTTYVGPFQAIEVARMVDTIEITPNPFTPDGNAEITFRITGRPGADDLQAYFSYGGQRNFPLAETPEGSGNYEASSTLVLDEYRYPDDRNYTLNVRAADNSAFAVISESFRILTITNFNLDASDYSPTEGDVATLNADGVAGLNPGGVVSLNNETLNGLFYERQQNAAAIVEGAGSDGWIYTAGDSSTSVDASWLEGAPINADGSLGKWSRIAQLPERLRDPMLVTQGSHLLLIGGNSDSGPSSDIYKITIATDGSVDVTTPTGSLPTGRYFADAVITNGYLYVTGGYNSQTDNTVIYAPVDADGNVGAFQSGPNTISRRGYSALATNGDYLYISAGLSDRTGVERAAINPDGSLSVWEAVSPLTTQRYGHESQVVNGRLVVFGGFSNTDGHLDVIESAAINPDGTLGNFIAEGSMLEQHYLFGSAVNDSIIYAVAGYNDRSGVGDSRGVEWFSVDGSGAPTAGPDGNEYGVIPLSEISDGVYQATYDFTDEAGHPLHLVNSNYNINLIDQNNGIGYEIGDNFELFPSVTDIVISDDPFTPDGIRELEVFVTADPGLAGLRFEIDGDRNPLTETSTPGVYRGVTNYVINGQLPTPGTKTIFVIDELNRYFESRLNFDVSLFGSLLASPTAFKPGENEVTNFLTSGVSGENIEVRLTRNGSAASGLLFSRNLIYNGVFSANDRLYVVGGANGQAGLTPESAIINPDGTTQSWALQQQMETARQRHVVVASDTHVYAIGGNNISSVEYAPFNPDGTLGEWQSTTPMTRDINYTCGVLYDGRIYLFGGLGGSSAQREEIYAAEINGDGTLGEWTVIGSLPGRLYGHQAIVHNDRVYILGGYISNYRQEVHSAQFQPDGSLSEWVAEEPMNSERYQFAVAKDGNFIYAFGSTDNRNGRDNMEVSEVQPDGSLGPWSLLSESIPFEEGGYAIAGGRIYAAGGNSSAVYYSEIQPDNTLGPFEFDLIGTLPLIESTENPGSYSAEWNGADELGRPLASGIYRGDLFNSDSGFPYRNRSDNVEIRDSLTSFEVIPYYFVPTGNNTAKFRATGSPGQVGLYTSWFTNLPLSEVSPGVYETEFDFVNNGTIQGETTSSTLTLFNASNQNTGITTQITIRHTRNFQATPSTFSPNLEGTNLSTFSVDGEPGLNLNATLFSSWGRHFGLLQPRTQHSQSSFTIDNRIYLVGGRTNGSAGDEVEMVTINADGTFDRPSGLTSAPVERYLAGAAAYNGHVYFAGGLPNNQPNNRDVYRAPILPNGRLGDWVRESDVNVGRYGVSLEAHDGWLYLIGGFSGTYENTIERAPINPDGSLGPWQNDLTIPYRPYLHQTLVIEGYLYVIGGAGSGEQSIPYRAAFQPDGTLGAWEALPTLPNDRYQFGAVTDGALIYLTGGVPNAVRNNIDILEIAALDAKGEPEPEPLEWTRVESSLPVNIYDHSAAVINNHLYLLGGNTSQDSQSPAIYRSELDVDGTPTVWEFPTLPGNVALTPDEDGTQYSYDWDGTDSEGKILPSDLYTWRITNADSGVSYPGSRNVRIEPSITVNSITPNLLIADGINEAVIEIESLPGLTGLYAHFYNAEANTDFYNNRFLEFTETEAGVYQARWNAFAATDRGNRIYPDGIYNLRVYSDSGQLLSEDELTLEINGIAAINRPDEFTPGGGATLPIQLQAPEGLDPLVEIYNNQTGFLVRTIIPVPGVDGYDAPWDGRDENGDFTGPNQYQIRVLSKASNPPLRYYPISDFTVLQGVFGIEVTPNPFTPDGSNTASILIQADPGQTGLTAEFEHPAGLIRTGVPMTESSTPGQYTGEWDGRDDNGDLMLDGFVTVSIRDGEGDLFPLTGAVTITTISRFAVGPNPFTPRVDPLINVEVDMIPGRTLTASIGSLVDILLTEDPAGTYSGSWDAKDENDEFVAPGNYPVTVSDSEIGVLGQTRQIRINEVDFNPPTARIVWNPPAPPIGVGVSTFTLEANELLQSVPTLTITPNNGDPIEAVFDPVKNLGPNFTGSVTIPEGVLNGPAQMAWQGVDRSGNTGNQFSGTDRVTIDTLGPVASSITITPSITGNLGLGSKSLSLTLNENAQSAPQLTFTPPLGAPIEIALTGGPRVWNGSINITEALGEGVGSFTMSATDLVGNTGATISNNRDWTLDFTAPGPPAPLQGEPEPNGRIFLNWIAATGQPYNYQLWRIAGAGDPLTGNLINGNLFANSYRETPPAEGEYSYAITATDRAGNVSAASNTVTVVSDATAPNPPVNAAAAADGDQVEITWDAPAGEAPVSYNLYYRAGSDPIISLSGVQRLQTGITGTSARTTPNPVGDQHFAVTALDAAGNESPVSNSAAFFFESPLAAPGSLAISYDRDSGATLSWPAVSGDVAGYLVSRNGTRITPDPITDLTFTDMNAPTASNALYGVRAVTSANTPGDQVLGTMKPLNLLADAGDLTIEPNLLQEFRFTATNPGANDVTIQSGRLELLSESGAVLQTLNVPFSETIGSGESSAGDAIYSVTSYPASLRTVAVLTADEGNVTLTAERTQPIVIRPAGVRVEVFADPLVRGVPASVRLRFSNPSNIPLDIVTAVGADPSPDVYVEFVDEDGVPYETAFLNQRGNGVFNTPDYAKIVLLPGESFLTDPIAPVVPLDAPETVFIRGGALRTYSDYGLSNQVEGPGMRSAPVPSTPTVTDYRGLANVAGELFALGTQVDITGQALSNTDDSPVPNADILLGLDVKGFPRFYSVQTDENGDFEFTFTPLGNEFGRYTVWAVHPDVRDQPAQDTFQIGGIDVPNPINLRMAKNSTLDFNYPIRSRAQLTLNDLSVQWIPDVKANDIVVTPTLRSASLPPEGSVTVDVSVFAPIDADDEVTGRLRVSSAEGFIADSVVAIELRPAQPVLRATPSFINTTMSIAGSFAAEIEVENVGFDSLRDAVLQPPSVPWIQYTVDPDLGEIAPGEKRTIGIVLTPGVDETLTTGNYTESFSLSASNSSTLSWNVFATFTSSESGNVLFKAEDVITETLEGAKIEIGSAFTSELFYEGFTDEDGEWLLEDIPTGEYNYRMSSSGHDPVVGSVIVRADDTVLVRHILSNTFVTVEWEVVPVNIEDDYEIILTTTFETFVPAPVLVAIPPSLTHQMTRPGVSNALFKVKNEGLIAGNNFQINPSTSSPGLRIELLVDLVDVIFPQQTIEVPYRVVLDETVEPGKAKQVSIDSIPGLPKMKAMGYTHEELLEELEKQGDPIGCGLGADLLAILNYICRLESLSSGVPHKVKPEVGAAAVGIGAAVDSASVVCSPTGCNSCCLAIANCSGVFFSPGSLGPGGCILSAAQCLSELLGLSGGGGGFSAGGFGGPGGGTGPGGGGYGGISFSPCTPAK